MLLIKQRKKQLRWDHAKSKLSNKEEHASRKLLQRLPKLPPCPCIWGNAWQDLCLRWHRNKLTLILNSHVWHWSRNFVAKVICICDTASNSINAVRWEGSRLPLENGNSKLLQTFQNSQAYDHFQTLWHNRLREVIFSGYLTGHKFLLQFANFAKINIMKTLCSEASGQCEG